jgi:DNA-binding IclR family transcriptional regulator
MTNVTAPRPPRRIQSVDVGFRIVRILEQAAGKLPLKRIAAEARMAPSKVYLYLSSYAALGLVEQDEATGHYGLGTYAVQLGLSAIRQLNIVDLSKKPLEQLQLATGQSAYLSIWGNMGPVILLKYDSDLNSPVGIKVGSVLPLLRSATGRIFLSYLPETDLGSVLHREESSAPKTVGSRKKIIADVRVAGVAGSDGQVYEGFAALSAPIFDHAGTLAGSFTILGLRRDFNPDTKGTNASLLLEAVHQVSVALGYGGSKTEKS